MYIFCFDVESDGLYGEGFAYGAVVYSEQGSEMDACQLGCLDGIQDQWVKENCLPYLSDLPRTDSRQQVRQSFWQFYLKWKEKCHIFADVAYPVDAQFLRKCAQENDGIWDAPFPLLDVASVMFACGEDPLVDGAVYTGITGAAHQPLYDARVSAHKLLRLIREGKLKLPSR